MDPKAIEIKVAVVYSPLDDAMGSESAIMSREEAAQDGVEYLCDILTEHIPDGYGCTIIKGWKELTDEDH